jgi:hypothetical protein
MYLKKEKYKWPLIYRYAVTYVKAKTVIATSWLSTTSYPQKATRKMQGKEHGN